MFLRQWWHLTCRRAPCKLQSTCSFETCSWNSMSFPNSVFSRIHSQMLIHVAQFQLHTWIFLFSNFCINFVFYVYICSFGVMKIWDTHRNNFRVFENISKQLLKIRERKTWTSKVEKEGLIFSNPRYCRWNWFWYIFMVIQAQRNQIMLKQLHVKIYNPINLVF